MCTGLAVAVREPLLSIAGRVAIFACRIYDAGDRVQIGDSSGGVIDVSFFYTRLMEIGNWIGWSPLQLPATLKSVLRFLLL